jgi:hypothetical protein
MGEARYPKVPATPAKARMMQERMEEEAEAVRTELMDASTSTALSDSDQPSSSPTPAAPVARPWLGRHTMRIVAVCMFAFIFVLLAVVCFLLGRMYGRDRRGAGYAEVLNDDSSYPTGGQYGSLAGGQATKHDPVLPHHRVATTTRNA